MKRETASSIAGRGLGAERWSKEDTGPIVCLNCGETFEGYVLWRSYCSPRCKRQAAYQRRKLAVTT